MNTAMKEVAFYNRWGKRMIDIIIAIVGIIILFFPMAIIAVLVRLDSPGPVFFVQKRSGKDRVPFNIVKFRTMPADASHYIASNSMADKENLTHFQKFLRKSSIDELPQIWNILKGDMSVVGPRPVICEETFLIDERDKYDANGVRPGLTGWAQINGRDNVCFEEKAQLDGEYIKKMSFSFDLKCILLTVGILLNHDGFNDNIKMQQ